MGEYPISGAMRELTLRQLETLRQNIVFGISTWTRWSDYEITTFDHVEYLVPAEKATPLAYDCAEQAEQLVADALELGRQLRMGTPDKNRLCAAFAARHGLLGQAGVKCVHLAGTGQWGASVGGAGQPPIRGADWRAGTPADLRGPQYV